MSDYQALKIVDYDHLEFAVEDLEKHVQLFQTFGFTKVATRNILERKLTSHLMVQNGIRVLISQSSDPTDPVAKYVADHGDGVVHIALLCENAVNTFETTLSRGAEVAEPPKAHKKDFGSVERASIKAYGDVSYTFISRSGDLFAEGFDSPLLSKPEGFGLQRIDHITTNVESGQLDRWKDYYSRIFGMKSSRFFDIKGERTGLISHVFESPDGILKMPMNEPTESESQIQEFLDIHHGAGVQHVALASSDIVKSLTTLRNQNIDFLEVPSTYYEAIPSRVPNVVEDLNVLEKLQILVDGSEKGYLLQIFTKNFIGPFFYEVIQRKGDDGFGEGNFTALFEAIERDQVQRGVLKAEEQRV